MTTYTRFKLRNGTAAEWSSANPTLLSGEIGVESDTRKHKFGDGVTAWNSLPYAASSGGGAGTVTSVDLDVPLGFEASGGPVTTSGSITLSYASGYQGFTTAEASKLAGIAAGAEVNVNADWNATSGDAEILNKPTLGGAAALDVGTTAGDVVQLDGSGRLPAVDGSQLTNLPSAGGTPGGSDTQVQFNDSGSFGGSADLTWDDNAKELGVGGDINLDDGGTYVTTLQMVTPTADRTISFPNATGTIALVAGSNGQLVYNNAGSQSGLSTLTTDGTNITLSGQWTSTLNGAASAPPVSLTGTWFTGGTSTTTKPQFLIEPAGTTSTNWDTNGTGLGVNAVSGFSGNLLDLQVDGVSKASIDSSRAYLAAATLNIPNLPEYADDSAAGTGGLVAGDVYKTSTGELRIKL